MRGLFDLLPRASNVSDISHDDAMADLFRRDPAYAAELLRAVLQDGDRDELLILCRHIAVALNAILCD